MRRLVFGTLAALLLAAPAGASDGEIGLFFDANASSCEMNIPCDCSGRLYVYGLLLGASAGGITGAEYKITFGSSSADPGWFVDETFEPGATILGGGLLPADPVSRGVNVAWPACQQGNGYLVLIETVEIFNPGCNTNAVSLQVVRHDRPSNAQFQCPLFVLCDAPVYTKVCLGSNRTQCPNPNPPFPNDATCSTSGWAYVNPPPNVRCCLSCPLPEPDCTIQVKSRAWTHVKALYRN